VKNLTDNKTQLWNPYSWILFIIFFSIGVLNILLIHPIPGIIYVLLSTVYLPPFSKYLNVKFRIKIPIIFKVILAFFILWFTLGLSDLMELFEAFLIK